MSAMAYRARYMCRCCRLALLQSRLSPLPLRVSPLVRPLSSEAAPSPETDPLPPPPPKGTYPEKIQALVRDISLLTLLETAQLNELLKTTLNIPDAPLMAMPATTASQQTTEEPQEEEQTEFTVKLVSFADDSKIKLIKEIKAVMEGMNLVQSKKFVESLPQVVQKGVNKEEAERLKTALEAAGGTVELE